MAGQVTKNLNRIIDVNYYPVKTAERSNMRHRPIGMGVQAGPPSTAILPACFKRVFLQEAAHLCAGSAA